MLEIDGITDMLLYLKVKCLLTSCHHSTLNHCRFQVEFRPLSSRTPSWATSPPELCVVLIVRVLWWGSTLKISRQSKHSLMPRTSTPAGGRPRKATCRLKEKLLPNVQDADIEMADISTGPWLPLQWRSSCLCRLYCDWSWAVALVNRRDGGFLDFLKRVHMIEPWVHHFQLREQARKPVDRFFFLRISCTQTCWSIDFRRSKQRCHSQRLLLCLDFFQLFFQFRPTFTSSLAAEYRLLVGTAMKSVWTYNTQQRHLQAVCKTSQSQHGPCWVDLQGICVSVQSLVWKWTRARCPFAEAQLGVRDFFVFFAIADRAMKHGRSSSILN